MKIVKINTNYFGELEVDENEILEFEKGMLGFEELKKFVIIKDSEIFIEWLHIVVVTTSFAIMDPFVADNNYSFELPEKIMEQLDIKSKEDGTLATNLLTFTVPLLLVWMYDLLRFRRKRKEKK